jgi:hypothetical protein
MRYYAIACVIAAVTFGAVWTPMTAQAYPQTDNELIRQWVWDYSGWLPLQDLDVTFKVANCPGLPTAGGCYIESQKTIYMAPDSIDKQIVAHELGHAFDDQILDDGNRNKIMFRYFFVTGQPWAPYYSQDALDKCFGTNICSNEMFADGFSACARHVTPVQYPDGDDGDLQGSYGLSWTTFLQKNLCKFIVKVGSRYHK